METGTGKDKQGGIFKKNTLGILLISLALGLAATLLVNVYINMRINAVSGGKLVSVIFAGQEIPPQTMITEDMIVMRNVPQAYLHLQSITQNYKEYLLGQKTAVDIKKNQALLWTDIYLDKKETLSQRLRTNERAIAIHTDDISGINGLIKPGDSVDVLASFDIPGSDYSDTKSVTKVLLQDAVVLAVGSDMSDEDHPFGGGTKKSVLHPASSSMRAPSTITLRVSPEEASILAFAERKGEIRLVLRSKEDVFINDMPEVSYDDMLQFEDVEVSGQRQRIEDYPTVYEGGLEKGNAYWPDEAFVKKYPDLLNKNAKEISRIRQEYLESIKK